MSSEEFQTVFNIAVMAAGGAIGWILNTIWQAVKGLQEDDKKLTDRLSATEKLIAGDYVKRDEWREDMKKISDGLGRIYEKLDKKVDKK